MFRYDETLMSNCGDYRIQEKVTCDVYYTYNALVDFNNSLDKGNDSSFEVLDKYIKEHGGTTNNNAGEYIAAVAFKIIPKETISGVNSFKLNNFKVTYENGVTEDLGSITFNNKNTYLANNEYGFHYKYYTNEDVRNQKVHINADIVIDTLNEQNKVIGRLDYDTTAKAWSATYA